MTAATAEQLLHSVGPSGSGVLAPDDLGILLKHHHTLEHHDLVTANALAGLTTSDLQSLGLTAGASSLLKRAFPSRPAAIKSAPTTAGTLTHVNWKAVVAKLWGHKRYQAFADDPEAQSTLLAVWGAFGVVLTLVASLASAAWTGGSGHSDSAAGQAARYFWAFAFSTSICALMLVVVLTWMLGTTCQDDAGEWIRARAGWMPLVGFYLVASVLACLVAFVLVAFGEASVGAFNAACTAVLSLSVAVCWTQLYYLDG